MGECDQDFIDEADGESYWCPAFEHTRYRVCRTVIPKGRHTARCHYRSRPSRKHLLLFPFCILLAFDRGSCYRFHSGLKTPSKVENWNLLYCPNFWSRAILVEWITGMVTYRQVYVPFGQDLEIFNHGDRLLLPMQMISEFIVMGVVFARIVRPDWNLEPINEGDCGNNELHRYVPNIPCSSNIRGCS